MHKTAGRIVVEVRIIEASVELFSTRGFKGTSTRQIAHMADVSEATLFRHFPRKTDVFVAAIESRLKQLKLGRELQTGLANDVDPARIVPLIVRFLLETLVEQPQLLRLLYVAAIELRGSDRMFREHLGPIFDAVNAYFRRCAAKGMVCNLDTSMITLGMAAAVVTDRPLHQLFAEKTPRRSAKNTAREYSQLWLNALRQQTSGQQLFSPGSTPSV